MKSSLNISYNRQVSTHEQELFRTISGVLPSTMNIQPIIRFPRLLRQPNSTTNHELRWFTVPPLFGAVLHFLNNNRHGYTGLYAL